MIKKIAYILIPACMTLSVAVAEPVSSNPVQLSSDQMDQVTAGAGASVNVGATATGSVFVLTDTTAVAFTTVTNPDNPVLGGYVEVAGGAAVAVAPGQGSSTGTTVSPTTSSAGLSGSRTIQASGHFQNSTLDVSANMINTVGSPYTNPF